MVINIVDINLMSIPITTVSISIITNSVTTLNVNGLNAPIDRDCLNGSKNITQLYVVYNRST